MGYRLSVLTDLANYERPAAAAAAAAVLLAAFTLVVPRYQRVSCGAGHGRDSDDGMNTLSGIPVRLSDSACMYKTEIHEILIRDKAADPNYA